MKKISIALAATLALGATNVLADDDDNESSNCQTVLEAIGGHSNLEEKLKMAQSHVDGNGGFGLHMWGTVVSDDGTVCAVAKTGTDINAQWLGSRVISAQKANTANSFSLQSDAGNGDLDGLALSTANLWAATQPGGSLFGLQFSNPVDTKNAYRGNSKNYGNTNDPMVGKKIGGVNVFGGGLALYNAAGDMIGAIGVSGDSSCADHNIAWRTRNLLGLDNVSTGVGAPGDNIIFDLDTNGKSARGFGHPTCNGASISSNTAVISTHPLN